MDPIAKVDAPGKRSFDPIGAVVESGEEAADASDRQSNENGRDVFVSGSSGDACDTLAQFNAQPSTQQAAENRLSTESDAPIYRAVG